MTSRVDSCEPFMATWKQFALFVADAAIWRYKVTKKDHWGRYMAGLFFYYALANVFCLLIPLFKIICW